MGKAYVYEHLGDGLYSILYERDTSLAAARIAELQARKAQIDEDIYGTGQLFDQREAKQQEINAAQAIFENWLNAWADCAVQMPPCPEAATYEANYTEAAKTLIALRSDFFGLSEAIAILKAEQLSATYEIGHLTSYATDKSQELIQAWCADRYAYGEVGQYLPAGALVGTLETYGARMDARGGYLPQPRINIAPAWSGQEGYDLSVHHVVQPLASQSTATALFNYAQFLFAGLKNCEYATAKVLEVTSLGLKLRFFGGHPSQQVPVRYPTFVQGAQGYFDLANVPAEYMNCHEAAFEVNDWVIVHFEGPLLSAPKVIGFADHPRVCKFGLYYRPCSSGYLIGEMNQAILPGEDGTPVEVVVTDESAAFTEWSDGNQDLIRQDFDVTETISVTAVCGSSGGGPIYWPPDIQMVPRHSLTDSCSATMTPTELTFRTAACDDPEYVYPEGQGRIFVGPKVKWCQVNADVGYVTPLMPDTDPTYEQTISYEADAACAGLYFQHAPAVAYSVKAHFYGLNGSELLILDASASKIGCCNEGLYTSSSNIARWSVSGTETWVDFITYHQSNGPQAIVCQRANNMKRKYTLAYVEEYTRCAPQSYTFVGDGAATFTLDGFTGWHSRFTSGTWKVRAASVWLGGAEFEVVRPDGSIEADGLLVGDHYDGTIAFTVSNLTAEFTQGDYWEIACTYVPQGVPCLGYAPYVPT
jgi:hypothetical protein